VSSMEFSLKRHPFFPDYTASPHASRFRRHPQAVANSGAFPFFNQQGATSFMGLASWFASSKKPARMTFFSGHPKVREKFQLAVEEN
jgi:hypothetical protein